MRIVIISDTHETHTELEIPPADVLIHCGDWSFFGKSPRMMDDFNQWLETLPVRHRLITCGNHEFPVEKDPLGWKKRLTNATLLLNESITVEGVRLFFSPTTSLWSGAFGLSSELDRTTLYNTIPPIDILVTHGPPAGILDGGQGCPVLRKAVARIKPRLHAFGHIHSAYGIHPTTHTLFVNAAALDANGAPSHKPIVLDFHI